MSDHAELVREMAELEKLTSQERLKLAKTRRMKQLKRYAEYDKKSEKHEKQAQKRKFKASSVIQVPHSSQAKQKVNSLPSSTSLVVKAKQPRHIAFDKGVMLLEAAARNDIGEVKALLEEGVNPDVANEDGLTALHQCCIDDSEEMLKLLLEHGANVNSRDSELWTPLHAASTCAHLRICQHLLSVSADLLAVNADGNMPYDICDDEATLEYIETVMANQGVTQELIDETRLSSELNLLNDIKEFEREGNAPSAWKDRTGASLLHIAAANGYYDGTSYLLTKRLDVNAEDNDGWTPAMAAACWGQIPVLELLAQNGADLDVKTKDNKSLIDLVDDLEVKDQITEIKKEIKVNLERFKRDNSDVRRRSSTNIRSFGAGNTGSSSMYNSNTSLSDRNPFSSSVRRHSMREKHKLSMKEARDEARYRISINTGETEDLSSTGDSSNPASPTADTPPPVGAQAEERTIPVTNIDDIDMTVTDNNVTTINITEPTTPSASVTDILPAATASPLPTANLNGHNAVNETMEPQQKLVATIQIAGGTDQAKPVKETAGPDSPRMNGDQGGHKAKIRVDSLRRSSDSDSENVLGGASNGDSNKLAGPNQTASKTPILKPQSPNRPSGAPMRSSPAATAPHQDPPLKQFTSHGGTASEPHIHESTGKNCCVLS